VAVQSGAGSPALASQVPSAAIATALTELAVKIAAAIDFANQALNLAIQRAQSHSACRRRKDGSAANPTQFRTFGLLVEARAGRGAMLTRSTCR
jgi:hypothetical protein